MGKGEEDVRRKKRKEEEMRETFFFSRKSTLILVNCEKGRIVTKTYLKKIMYSFRARQKKTKQPKGYKL